MYLAAAARRRPGHSSPCHHFAAKPRAIGENLVEALEVPVICADVCTVMQGEREQNIPDLAVEALGVEEDGAPNQPVAKIALEPRHGDLERI